MKITIRILILEDNLADIDLIYFELAEAGIEYISRVAM